LSLCSCRHIRPDLNSIERLWLLIKVEWFADFTARTRERLIKEGQLGEPHSSPSRIDSIQAILSYVS